MILTLPWPPTVNTYWRNVKGRTLISRAGRAYRKLVGQLCLEQGAAGKRILGDLEVLVIATPPDKRKRDLDNILKSLLDSLTHAKVWEDDSQISDLRIRCHVSWSQVIGTEARNPDGQVVVHIRKDDR